MNIAQSRRGFQTQKGNSQGLPNTSSQGTKLTSLLPLCFMFYAHLINPHSVHTESSVTVRMPCPARPCHNAGVQETFP